jgi:glutamate--cysteine ligase
MADRGQDLSAITPEFCREWIEAKVFPLQPESYRNQHPTYPGAVGLEIEMLPIRSGPPGQPPKVVSLHSGASSLASCLRSMTKQEQWRLVEDQSSDPPMLMGVSLDDEDQLTFEPGGQLEFSSKPYDCLTEAMRRTVGVQSILDRHLASSADVTLIQVGMNPWYSVSEIGLQMPKSRYRAMDQFFSKISSFGPQMMRQTCTIQVNLDFGPTETVMAKRFLASMLLAPISGAIFNYSAFESGKLLDVTGYRQRVWRHLDPSRTDIPNLTLLLRSLDKKACVETWFEFVLGARVVFLKKDNYRVVHERVSLSEWMKNGINGMWPDVDDFETHLSLLFPEVRAKGFLELRSVDCQARVWQFVPAAWWTGLLYDARALDEVLELLEPFAPNINSMLRQSEGGLRDPVLRGLAEKLITISIGGLKRLPSCYFGDGALKTLMVFAELFVNRGRVPANDLIDEFKRTGRLDLECFQKVQNLWSERLAEAPDPEALI